MSGLPVLYTFRRCPYAVRARLAPLASETSCVVREIRLSAKPPELIDVSPKATVPVLILPDGRVIDQSLDIMRWALARYDPSGWLDRTDMALIETNDGAFKHHLDRAKYPDRYGEDAALHRGTCIDLLCPIEDRLSGTQFICADKPGLTDAAILPFIRQFASIDRESFDALPMPHLQNWLNCFIASPLFADVMLRFTPWKAGDAESRFP